MTTINDKLNGEIAVDLMEDIIKTLPTLIALYSTDHSILVHGMGEKPKSFYNSLRQNKLVELLWTGWSSNVWWTYLLSFIPGQAGLTKVLDRQHLDTIYLKIGAQSMCGLYFIPNKIVERVLDKIRKDRNPDITNLLENEKNYFLLTVDFDHYCGDTHGEIFYRQLVLGDKLDAEVKRTLTRTR